MKLCIPIASALAAAVLAFPGAAWAGELEDVQAEIAQKAEELEFLLDGISAEKSQIAELEQHQEGLLAELAEKQDAHARLQAEAAALAEVMYKDSGSFNVLALLGESSSLEEFLHRMDMREHMLSASADTLAELDRAARELDEDYAQASADADERRSLLADLKDKQDSLEELIAQLEQREKDLDIEQKIALAQAAAQAHEVAKTFETDEPAASSGGSRSDKAATGGRESAKAEKPSGDVAQDPDSGGAGRAEAESPKEEQPAALANDLPADGSMPDEAGWRSGIASAYGGSSDKMTPNPSTTATGTRCDDWSVGVAVPIAWGPGKYYGRYVEISYGGQSIIAPIVDCGGMGNGSRVLDLQPGVFKAFGANTCGEWGLREVRYRFL